MPKPIQLLSIALVTVIALTVVSAAGVFKAQAAIQDDLPGALDVEGTSWSNWNIAVNAGSVTIVSSPPPTRGDTLVQLLVHSPGPSSPSTSAAVVATLTTTGPGTLTFDWQWSGDPTSVTQYYTCWVKDSNGFQLFAKPSSSGSMVPGEVSIPSAGVYQVRWTLGWFGPNANKYAYLDNVQFTPTVTKDGVLTKITALQTYTQPDKQPAMFTNAKNHKAFDTKLDAVYKLVDTGTAASYAEAMDKVKIDLMQKTDGVAPDWVTTTDQSTIYAKLQSIYDDVVVLST